MVAPIVAFLSRVALTNSAKKAVELASKKFGKSAVIKIDKKFKDSGYKNIKSALGIYRRYEKSNLAKVKKITLTRIPKIKKLKGIK